MLTVQDLIDKPDMVQPLGTRKGLSNKPTHLNIDIKSTFISTENTNMLSSNLFKIYQQNGGMQLENNFKRLVPILMDKFLKKTDIMAYRTAEADAVGFNDYTTILRAINYDFIKMCYNYFKWNTYNPFQHDIEVGPVENRVLKKSYEMTPEDHGTLDLWREQFIQLSNNKFRDNNKIPFYRTGMFTRNYDRENEGLLHGNSDRASLDTPIYGYDMVHLKNGLCTYKSEEWYDM
jgi:hypothetical protein